MTNEPDAQPEVIARELAEWVAKFKTNGWNVLGDPDHVRITHLLRHGGWVNQPRPGFRDLTISVFHPGKCSCDLENLPGEGISYRTIEEYQTAYAGDAGVA